MYFIEIPFQGWGKSVHDSPASLYNPRCAPSLKDDKLFMAEEGAILCIFILQNIFERPPAILQSSSLPALQLPALTSYDLWLLAYRNTLCSNWLEEWKISHFTSKYFQHGCQQKIFKATAPCKLAVWFTTKPNFHLMSDGVCSAVSFKYSFPNVKDFLCFSCGRSL